MKEPLTLADKLIAHRRRRGLSQESLAEAANLSLRTVQRIEKGENLPRGFTLQALATALQLPVEALSGAAEPHAAPAPSTEPAATASSEDISTYVALMWLSCFSYVLLPGANIVLPLLLRYRKRHLPEVRAAGSRLLNFELAWTLLTYGGYLLLLALQIGLLLSQQYVLVLAPLAFLFTLNLLHAPRGLARP